MRLGSIVLTVLLAGFAAAAEKPNFVFIMADDLGYGDVGFHGGIAPTPNIDKLQREGVELTQHYVAPVCSPTRSALMTGRCWSRFNVTSPQAERALPWDTITLPRALKTAGYATCLTGKWHLGSKPDWGPNHFGFDHSYGSLGGGVGPYNHFYKKGEFSTTWHRDEKLIEEKGHATDLITDEAVGWIASHRDGPFFLYVPFTAVHIPIKEPEEYRNKVPKSIDSEVGRHYAACVMHLDASVGRIVEALEKAGVRENTLLVFTSDNGGVNTENNDTKYPEDDYPQGTTTASNKPLRAGKGTVYEGGTRVATVASWPGKLKPSKMEGPAQIIDWMPTLCGLAGVTPERDLKWDGMDIWPQISGQASAAPRTLYTVAPGYRSRALRVGDWKLIVHGQKDKQTAELYDLAKDPSETVDLASHQKARVDDMLARLAEVGERDRDAEVTEDGPKKGKE